MGKVVNRVDGQIAARKPQNAEHWLMGEPTLEELLADPIMRIMMAADRVCLADLRAILRRQQEALETATVQ